jgi:hypothetical protein
VARRAGRKGLLACAQAVALETEIAIARARAIKPTIMFTIAFV